MTIRQFQPNGDGTGDFFAADSWAPDGVPVAGDTLLVAGGDLVIDAADAALVPVLADLTMIIGPSATFSVAGETLAASFDILIAAGDQLTIPDGTLIDDGTIEIAGGTLVLGAAGTLAGTGTILVGAGGVVVADGSLAAGVTLAFADATGTLAIAGSTAPGFFHATVAGFQKGDVIDIPGAAAGDVHYSRHTGDVTIYHGSGTSSPEVAEFPLTNGVSLAPLLYVGEDSGGGAVLGVTAYRLWNGGTGDWFDSAAWTTPTGTNSYPLFADSATIEAGCAIVSAADFTAHGSLDNETIVLAGAGVTLAVAGGVFGQKLLIETGAYAQATLASDGTTTSDAYISVFGRDANLTLAIAGQLVNDPAATILVSSESRLDIAAGRLTNDGMVLIDNAATVAAAATLDGGGYVYLDGTARLTVFGSVGSAQIIDFGTASSLIVEPGADFQGSLANFQQGDTIVLAGVTADTASFDPATQELTVSSDGSLGPVVAIFSLPGTYGPTSFSAVPDPNGNTDITDTDPELTARYVSLPVDVAIPAGASIGLRDLLTADFGSAGLPSEAVISSLGSADVTDANPFSFWDPTDPSVSYWTLNGTAVAPDEPLTVAAADFGDVALVAGNQIVSANFITVDDAFDAQGNVAGQTTYKVKTIPSQVQLASAGNGMPIPGDIVAAASLIADSYTGVPNTEDCWNIAFAVSAAAGAPLPNQSYSTDPAQNVAGGFWRIAYAAGVTQPAVANWGSLVEGGDIVRVAWQASGGPHSFTVLSPMDQYGTIAVLDNGDNDPGYEAIGIDGVTYYTTTNPDAITIYRLDPADRYLVTGSGAAGQIVQGSTYANLILPIGAGDTIAAGTANSEIAGTEAVLGGSTITDFHAGDTIDLTDLIAGRASLSYDAGTGVLLVADGTDRQVTIDLPQGLPQNFQLSADGGEPGLDGGTLGTLYSSLFDTAAAIGSVVEDVPCFVRGTRIATATGAVAVECLRVGDEVRVARTAPGAAPGLAPGLAIVRWLGHRRIDLRRHPAPALVQPVRVARDAFACGQPCRPLLLSPDHAVFVDGVLIPIKHLINGSSIAQLAVSDVEYWHVELERHDILLAEGLAVESYLDTGNRAAFANGARHVDLHPDFAPLGWDAACADLVQDGAMVVATKRRLFARAGAGPDPVVPSLSLLAGGRPIFPVAGHRGRWAYAIPPATGQVCLISPAWMPAARFPDSLDRRTLGIRVFEICIDAVRRDLRAPGLRGFHPLEHTAEGPCRWTGGNAVIVLPQTARILTLTLDEDVLVGDLPNRAGTQIGARFAIGAG